MTGNHLSLVICRETRQHRNW